MAYLAIIWGARANNKELCHSDMKEKGRRQKTSSGKENYGSFEGVE
jgi:hypothetical protein